jgi:hypothetical protein
MAAMSLKKRIAILAVALAAALALAPHAAVGAAPAKRSSTSTMSSFMASLPV